MSAIVPTSAPTPGEKNSATRPAVSLQRRLLTYLLICAPLVWAVALAVSVNMAQHSVNELFDTELIRLARQVQVLLRSSPDSAGGLLADVRTHANAADGGEADLSDMAIAVWDARGNLIVSDREGGELPRHAQASGFVDETLNGTPWRIYYLQSNTGQWLVAAGQKAYERHELVIGLTATQIVPWLLVLPVLLALMAWAVRRALLPVHQIASDLARRKADDLEPVPPGPAPTEIRPLLQAMNSLFSRVSNTLVRERRFTADAAHELRTPLAVLRAQWDVVRRADGAGERADAERKFNAGLDRMDRLVTQMLALSRVESRLVTDPSLQLATAVHWSAIVEQVVTDCLPMADRRRVDIACDWPEPPALPLVMSGDEPLLTVLLRNLLDNAVRYADAGSMVSLRFTASQLTVENAGPGLSAEHFLRMGERFHRPDGQQEVGSGLGVSIVQRVADLHGLVVRFGPGQRGGMKVTVALPPSAPAPLPLPSLR